MKRLFRLLTLPLAVGLAGCNGSWDGPVGPSLSTPSNGGGLAQSGENNYDGSFHCQLHNNGLSLKTDSVNYRLIITRKPHEVFAFSRSTSIIQQNQ